MDSPRQTQGRPPLHTRLMVRQCHRRDRTVEDCAARCTCDNQHALYATDIIVSPCRGSAKVGNALSCKDEGLIRNLGRWRAHTGTCASDPVYSWRTVSLFLQRPLEQSVSSVNILAVVKADWRIHSWPRNIFLFIEKMVSIICCCWLAIATTVSQPARIRNRWVL